MATVRKTNRVLIVHEDTRTGGIAGEITARINERCFEWLDAPVLRVTAHDVPLPYAPSLEDFVLPQTADIVRAARRWRRTEMARRRAVGPRSGADGRAVWHYLGVGCFTAVAGFVGGGMIARADREDRRRGHAVRAGRGDRRAVQLVHVSGVRGADRSGARCRRSSIWRLRRARGARTTPNEGDRGGTRRRHHAPDGRIDRRGDAVEVAEEGRRSR